MTQPSLFDADEQSIEARFQRFHRDNPAVYETLVRFTRAARDRGKTRFGIHAVWERMRWELMMATTGDDGFSLNDHFTSRYARLLMAQEPDLAGIFETRRLRAV